MSFFMHQQEFTSILGQLKKPVFNHAVAAYKRGEIPKWWMNEIVSGRAAKSGLGLRLKEQMLKAIEDAAKMNKIAKSMELTRLIEAKKLSDQRNYEAKNRIISELLNKSPGQFKVDSSLNEKYVGITHKPSGFKIHTQRKLIPEGIEKMSNQKERVRVVLPYNGSHLLERLNNPAWPKNFGRKRHIGGGIEEGETPQEAAAREMFEELGVRVHPKDFKVLGKHENQHYLELSNHPLTPGAYKASVGSDPIITLEHTHPHGDDYWGPNLEIFKK